MNKNNTYDLKYAGEKHYWGKEPSAICDKVIELIKPTNYYIPRLIDIGCGEGRNAVYFAKNGFNVDAPDKSSPGLQKTERYANDVGVRVNIIHADIFAYELEEVYDVVFSTGTLMYLPRYLRNQRFFNYKQHTKEGCLNVHSVLITKPFIAIAPDTEPSRRAPFKSGELMGYYWDWEILYSIEEIFDCMSSGIPHKHAVNRIIAKKNTTKSR